MVAALPVPSAIRACERAHQHLADCAQACRKRGTSPTKKRAGKAHETRTHHVQSDASAQDEKHGAQRGKTERTEESLRENAEQAAKWQAGRIREERQQHQTRAHMARTGTHRITYAQPKHAHDAADARWEPRKEGTRRIYATHVRQSTRATGHTQRACEIANATRKTRIGMGRRKRTRTKKSRTKRRHAQATRPGNSPSEHAKQGA